jgi:hypothetical protein
MATYRSTGVIARTGRINQGVGFVFGAVFVLVGLTGFVVSGGHHAVGRQGGELFGVFQVNVLHNVVHLVVGAVMVAAAIMGERTARNANAAFGVVYLVLFASDWRSWTLPRTSSRSTAPTTRCTSCSGSR